MKEEEYKEYEASLNAYRDIKNSVDFAEKKGIEQGIEKGEESKTMKVVRIMNEKGYSNEEIAEVTELSIERVVELLKQINEQNIR